MKWKPKTSAMTPGHPLRLIGAPCTSDDGAGHASRVVMRLSGQPSALWLRCFRGKANRNGVPPVPLTALAGGSLVFECPPEDLWQTIQHLRKRIRYANAAQARFVRRYQLPDPAASPSPLPPLRQAYVPG